MMMNTLKIKAKQVQLCKDIIAYFTAKKVGSKLVDEKTEVTQDMLDRWKRGLFRRIELREAHEALTQHVSCPFFITKNHMAKASQKEGNSLYNLQKFIDHAAKHPPVEENEAEAEAETPAKKTPKKKSAPKKEAAAKKDKKKNKKEEPAEAEPAAEPVAETVETAE
jgi:hypothetical protein